MAIARRKRSGMFGLVATLVGVLLISGAPMVKAAEPSTGGVLPPNAQPLGYSLRDMARKIAGFTSSGNKPEYFPHSRLQILYYDGSEDAPPPDVVFEDGGVTVSGANSFTVTQGTQFYVPVQSASDSSPVVGNWPDRNGAVPYFFGPSQLGADNYRVIVDGVSTTLTPDYLVGPIPVTHLYDYDPTTGGTEGHEIITLAAFVDALPVGTHTVRIVGRLAGQGIFATYGWTHYGLDFTYTVTVTP